MGAPAGLGLGEARAFARDFPRDNMPRGYLWDLVDYVPALIDANLTGRGAWHWASYAAGGDIIAGIVAFFPTMTYNPVVVATANTWYESTYPDDLINLGAAVPSIQNPVQLVDEVILPDATGATVPDIVYTLSASPVVVKADAASFKPTLGVAYKSMFVGAGMLDVGPDNTMGRNRPGFIRFTVPGFGMGDPLAYDVNSFIRTTGPVTALAALPTKLLVFHKGSVERVIRDIPPTTPPVPLPDGATDVDYIGDMEVQPLYSQAGCTDPKSIAYWNDFCLFADDHGVFMTDGATVTNLVQEGGVASYWHPLFANKASIAACVFLNYYICTVKFEDNTGVTLVCDLPKRQWFRFSNVVADTYFTAPREMERCWAGIEGTARLAAIEPCFFPTLDGVNQVDDNGLPVLPSLETPWYRLGEEGRKRVRFVYLTYDARREDVGEAQVLRVAYATSPLGGYTNAGDLPSTFDYRRVRVPIGKFPYGVSFHVHQVMPTGALRVHEIALEASTVERSRL